MKKESDNNVQTKCLSITTVLSIRGKCEMCPAADTYLEENSNKPLTPVTVPSGIQPASLEILQMIWCGDQAYFSGSCDYHKRSIYCQNRWTKVAVEQSGDDDE